MDLEKIFKQLILLDLALFVLIFLSVFFEPKEVTNLYYQLPEGFLYTNLGAIISLILSVAYLVNLYLLYKFISFGKPLYVALLALSIPIIYLSGIDIASPTQYFLDWIGGMTSGAILVFLFFSPIKNKFKTK